MNNENDERPPPIRYDACPECGYNAWEDTKTEPKLPGLNENGNFPIAEMNAAFLSRHEFHADTCEVFAEVYRNLPEALLKSFGVDTITTNNTGG